MKKMENIIRDINAEVEEDRKSYISKCNKIKPLKKCDVKIPKIFFQTCWSHDIPPKWQSSPTSIKKMMPSWKYILMDDQENRDFVEKHFPNFLPYYDAFPYNIQRCDSVRYMFLYVHGGIYMDLDFEILFPLDELFTSDAEVYLVKSGNVGSYHTNSFMASKPGCKLWLEVIEEMKKPLPFYIVGKHFITMTSTGPLMLSRVVNKTGTVVSNLPAKYIMPCNVCNISCSTCESYLKPLEGSSWISYDTVFLNFWLCNWKKVVSFFILFLLLLLIAYIVRKYGISNDSLDIRDLFK